MQDNSSLIRELHQALFRREPMPSELTYWKQHFAAGGSVEAMRRELVGTHEFEFELRRQFKQAPSSSGERELLEALRRMALEGKPPFAVRKAMPPLPKKGPTPPPRSPLELVAQFRFKAA